MRAIVALSAASVLIVPGIVPGAPAAAQTVEPRVHVAHAIAMHGAPKYGPDFAHFDYVNPDAPKGGEIRYGVRGTFDSFNPYVIKGNPAAGGGAESLLTASADEPFTKYGLIAETVEWPEDRSWVAFTLRPEARWHDGRPITVEDVIFSLEILKKEGNPFFRFYYASITGAEKVGPRKVRFSFAEQNNQELPLIAGEIPILPRHYWRAGSSTRRPWSRRWSADPTGSPTSRRDATWCWSASRTTGARTSPSTPARTTSGGSATSTSSTTR